MNILIRKVVFYMAIAKEQLRQIIRENDIQNVGDIYTLLKVYQLHFWQDY